MVSPIQYVKDVIQEMQRVVWPGPRIVAVHTVIVIASMVVIIAIVGGIDSLLVFIIRKVILKG